MPLTAFLPLSMPSPLCPIFGQPLHPNSSCQGRVSLLKPSQSICSLVGTLRWCRQMQPLGCSNVARGLPRPASVYGARHMLALCCRPPGPGHGSTGHFCPQGCFSSDSPWNLLSALCSLLPTVGSASYRISPATCPLCPPRNRHTARVTVFSA